MHLVRASLLCACALALVSATTTTNTTNTNTTNTTTNVQILTCLDLSVTLDAGLCSGMSVSDKVCATAATQATQIALLKTIGALSTTTVCDGFSVMYTEMCTTIGGTLKTDICVTMGAFCKSTIDTSLAGFKDVPGAALGCTVDADCTPVALATPAIIPCCTAVSRSSMDMLKSMCDGAEGAKLSRWGASQMALAVAEKTCDTLDSVRCGIGTATRASLAPVAAIISAILALAVAF